MGNKDKSFRQVELRQPETGKVDVAWIPGEHAKKGKKLTIGADPSPWVVFEVYPGAQQVVENDQKRFKWVLGK